MTLSTQDLNKILTQNNVTRRRFIGTYPSCIFPLTDKKVFTFITNTDDHMSNGTHWNVWYGSSDDMCFFDTFGRSYDDVTFPEFYKYIAQNFKTVKYSSLQLQSKDSLRCGYFCIMFIYSLSLGIDYKVFLKEFSKDLDSNDFVVSEFVNSII